MRNERLTTHLLGAVYAFLFSFSTVGCLVTGWDLPDVSIIGLLLWCALFSVVFPLLLWHRRGGWILLILSFCVGIFLFSGGIFREQILSLVNTMSSHFRNVYSWPVFGEFLTDRSDFVLILQAYLISLGMSISICWKWSIWFVLPPALVPLVLCLLTTDTLPDVWVLYLLILTTAVLLITDWTRTQVPDQYGRLTIRVFFPAAAALALLFVLNPQETYVNRAAALQKNTVDIVEKVQSAADSVIKGGISITDSLAKEKLNLRSAGPKANLDYPVMRIRSPYTGTVYLRGRDYDVYTGTAWEATEDRWETIAETEMAQGTLSVSTYSVRDVLYIPYYAGEKITLTGGCVENSENLKSYQYKVSAHSVNTYRNSDHEFSDAGYTDLPEGTLEWAVPLVWDILAGMRGVNTVQDRAEVVGDYVRNSAAYALSTGFMDAGYDDFAQWFLEQSDTGYCVHFATAAAVLLRAANIPARYVEGFMVGCQQDQLTLVSNQTAHAWVEYYDGTVWTVLEATPGEALVAGEVIPEEDEGEETETALPEASETTADSGQPISPAQPQTPDSTGIPGTSNPSTGTEQDGRPGTGGIGSGNTGEKVSDNPAFRIPGWLKAVGLIFLCASIIPITGEIRRAGKRKRWNTGEPNQMALWRWKQCRKMAKQIKTALPGELDELAMKAAYSQHTLNGEELRRFDLFRRQIRQEIKVMPWYRKYYFRWILAVG